MNLLNTNTTAMSFEAFLKQGVDIRPMLPVGEHKVLFDGITPDFEKSSLTINFTMDGKQYVDVRKFSDKTAGTIARSLADLGRQFKLEGNISIDDLNKHVATEITVWAVIPEGYKSVFYNYSQPKVVVSNDAAETVVDGQDF